MRIYVLSGGILDADRAVIHPADDSGRKVSLPIMQILIQHSDRNILVDTGLPSVVAGDQLALQREYDVNPSWIRSRSGQKERVDTQLRMLNLEVSDINLVINTHFHFDHAGANALFPGVPIAVQEKELVAARAGVGYLPVWDAPGLKFQVARGDWSPYAGVEIISTPGHTAGHQSLFLRVHPQPWLFTADTAYTEEHWRESKLGAVDDVVTAHKSLDRLREIAVQENARVMFGHDIEQWLSLGMKDEPLLVADG